MLEDLPIQLELFIVTAIGLIFGSFATAIAYRVPRDIPWVLNTPDSQQSAYRSACPDCKTRLGLFDLVPIFSWIFLGGKCRHCGKEISPVYPIIEVTVFLMCVISYAFYDFSMPLLWMMLATPFLVALIAIDIEKMILPNQLVLILFVLGLFYQIGEVLLGRLAVWDFLSLYMGGAIVFAGFSWLLGFLMGKLLKKEALGFGDVKFFAVAGLWLGIGALPVFCLFSGILGIFVAILWKIVMKTPIFPFGPALILTFFILFHVESSHILDFALK